MNDLAVIIPARNECAAIATVIADIKRAVPHAAIVVVNDASVDTTAMVARRAGATVVLSPAIGLGIGGAVQLGIRWAYERGYRRFVRMDGDGQHDAQYIDQLLDHAQTGSFVIGARSRESFVASSDGARRIGSAYFTTLFKVLFKADVPDPTSGYICFDRSIARFFIRYYPTDYPEIESTALLVRAGVSVESVPLIMRPRLGGTSSINVYRAIIYMVAITLSLIFSRNRSNPYVGLETV